MHKLFNKKRTFPDNWQNLSQEQVLENVKYLIENYKKYNIVFYGDKVQIGNIFIHKSEMQILGCTYPVYVINNRMFTVYSEVGHKISELIYHCGHLEDEKNLSEKLDEFLKKRLNLKEDKSKEKPTEKSVKQKIKEIVIPFGVAMAVTSPIALLMYEVYDMNIKLQQTEERAKRVEEMEKKVQELESKAINMMDTIKQNNR